MNRLGISAIAILFSFALGGCDRDGPIEEAGEGLDDAAEEIKDQIDPEGPAEKAGEAIDEAVDDAGEEIEEAGEELQR